MSGPSKLSRIQQNSSEFIRIHSKLIRIDPNWQNLIEFNGMMWFLVPPDEGTPILWGEREKESFQALKKAITTEPVLRYAQIGQIFILDPDSSQFTIGAVLQQYAIDPDDKLRLHPIVYLSKKLTEMESRYSTQERELLAAKYALDHWRHIIEGSEILIRSDHQSL